MDLKLLRWVCIVGYLLAACASGDSFSSGLISEVAQSLGSTNTGSNQFTFGQDSNTKSSFSHPLDLFITQSYSRPLTGTFIEEGWGNGPGKLTIKNDGNDLDAVAVLTYPNKAVFSAVYIRSRDSFAITGIPDGTYDLYFTLGREWNSSSGNFTLDNSFFEFEGTLPFETTVEGDYQYIPAYSVTLYTVINGNAGTNVVNEEEFPHLGQR